MWDKLENQYVTNYPGEVVGTRVPIKYGTAQQASVLNHILGKDLYFYAESGCPTDPDGLAYIAAIEATGLGTVVTPVQKCAIHQFYISAKASGYYNLISRMPFPIWGAAAPNAICMKSLAVGTFTGGVTHGPGYVQGDGVTGHYKFNVNPQTLGLTGTNSSIWGISQPGLNAFGECLIGGEQSFAFINFTLYRRLSINTTAYLGNQAGSVATATHQHDFFGGTRVGTRITLHRRNNTNGHAIVATRISTSTNTAIPPFISALRREEQLGLGARYFTQQANLYGFGLGFTDQQMQDLSLHAKVLLETCTGVVLT